MSGSAPALKYAQEREQSGMKIGGFQGVQFQLAQVGRGLREDGGDGHQEHAASRQMTTPSFTQIEPAPWPSGHGDLVAVISRPIEILSDRFGLRLFEGSDNLDAYRAAAVRLRSGRQLGLMWHQGAPAPGTELHADADDDFLSALREFLDAFELSADDLEWVREDVPLDHLRLAENAAGS